MNIFPRTWDLADIGVFMMRVRTVALLAIAFGAGIAVCSLVGPSKQRPAEVDKGVYTSSIPSSQPQRLYR